MISRIAVLAGIAMTGSVASAQIWGSAVETRWGVASAWQLNTVPAFSPSSMVEVNSLLAPVPGMPADRIIDIVDASGNPLGVLVGSMNARTTIRIPTSSIFENRGTQSLGSSYSSVIVSGTFITNANPFMFGTLTVNPGAAVYTNTNSNTRIKGISLIGSGATRIMQGRMRVRDSIDWASGNVDGANGRYEVSTYADITGTQFPVATMNAGTWTDGSWYIGPTATLAKQSSGTVELMRDVVADGTNSLTSDGVVDVTGGELQLYGGSLFNGPVFTSNGARIRFMGGTHTFPQGSSSSGDFTVEPGAAVVWAAADGRFTVNGGSFRVNAVPGQSLGALTLNSGFFRADAPATVSTRMSVTNSTLQGLGGSLSVTGGLDFNAAGDTAINNLPVSWTGESNWRASAGDLVMQLGTLTIGAGRTFTIEGNRTLFNGTIQNAGTLRKTGGTGTTTLNAANVNPAGSLNNSGIVSVSTGTLRLVGGGTHSGTFTSTGTGNLVFAGGIHTLQGTTAQITGRPTTIDGSGTAVSFNSNANAANAQLIVQNNGLLSIDSTPTSAMQNPIVNNASFGGSASVGTAGMSVTNGSLGGWGILFLNGTSTLTQTAGNFTTWGKPVIANGTVNVEGTGDIIMLPANGGSLGTSFGATMNFNANKTVREPTISSSSTANWNINGIVNFGEASGTAGSVGLGGNVNVNSGSLTLNVGGTHANAIFSTFGGPLVFGKGTHTIQSSSFQGNDFQVLSGTVNIGTNSNAFGSGWDLRGGTVNFQSSQASLNSLRTSGGGTVNAAGIPVAVSLPATLGQSSLGGPSAFTFDLGATINGTLSLSTTADFFGTTSQQASVNVQFPGVLRIPAGATWNVVGDHNITTTNPINVSGTLRKTASSVIASTIGRTVVTGRLESQSGTLNVLSLDNIVSTYLSGGTYETSNSGVLVLPTFDVNRATLIQRDFTMNTGIRDLKRNEGSVVLTGATYSLNTVDMENAASLSVEGGTLDLVTNGRTYTQKAGSTRVNGTLFASALKLKGGTLEGSGTLSPNTYDMSASSLAIRPGAIGNGIAGQLTMNGPVNFGTATCQIELNSADDDCDRILVGDGSSVKDAFVSAAPLPGFAASAGTKWRFMSAPNTISNKFRSQKLNSHFLEPLDQTNARGLRLIRDARYALVKFTVAPESYAGPITQFPVRIELREGGTLIYAGEEFPDANGSVAIPTFAGTELTVVASGPGYLRMGLGRILEAGGDIELGTYALRGGDADGDNEVTILDYLLVSAAFETTSTVPGWDPRADIDGDGEVSILDYLLVSSNYERVGD